MSPAPDSEIEREVFDFVFDMEQTSKEISDKKRKKKKKRKNEEVLNKDF